MSDAVAPPDLVNKFGTVGHSKTVVPAWQLVLRAFLATLLLGAATAVALMFQEETGSTIAGALLFPLGLTLVVLLGLELVTGAFGLVPMAVLERRATIGQCLRVFFWMIVGHLIGGLVGAAMIAGDLTGLGTRENNATAQAFVDLTVEKTLDYQESGVFLGISWVILSAILCNWLVVLGVIMGLASSSIAGKIMGIWLPIFAFFALGFEHAVVNFIVIPTGIFLGAPVGIDDWWLWNQIPVLIGNFIGGVTLATLGLYYSQRTRRLKADEEEATEDA